ncbi:hypothetical protein FDP41_009031 [Naegleria fowleri]|uniref:Uncharacterized protein n=1 Tax=Naegleria fowleri TaxID=5763 RepID=A0A6A5BD53_NAEFO|nr:uncharacterized protein FDP41_009031 [Naegleria fowleri]KAF0972782.1 hypothetical protein FDP41_009031 [Naegleria fowleri]
MSSATTADVWPTLLNDLREKIEISKHDKPNRAKKQLLIDALDRVFDEIKSGEYNHPSTTLQQHAPSLFSIFEDILSHFDDWSFKQTISFALIHFYFTFSKDDLLKLLKSSEQQQGSEHHQVLQHLLDNITDSKREVRDATAQSLGGLSKVIGVESFLSREFILDILQHPKKKQPDEPYKAVEGLMNTLGYILKNCSMISRDDFEFIINILFENTSDQKFESYSSYVRRYAVRSLTKALESPVIHDMCANIPSLLSQFKKVIFERFHDQDIDVRRANGLLFLNFLNMLIAYEDLSKRCLENQEETSSSSGAVSITASTSTITISSILEELISLLNNCSSPMKWQFKHGVCLAFESISKSVNVLKTLSSQLVSSINSCLFKVLTCIPETSKHDKSASNPNAIAGKTLCNLFITIFVMNTTNMDCNNAEQILSPYCHLNSNEGIIPSYFNFIKDSVIFMLKSDDPLLLDAGNYSVIQLISNGSLLIQMIQHSFLNDLLSLVYKNTFHASYPIKSGAMLCLNRAAVQIFMKTIIPTLDTTTTTATTTTLNTSLEDLITQLTVHVISVLIEESKSTNYEVRESVFKAFEDLFMKTKNTEPCTNMELNQKIFQVLLFGATDTMNGSNNSDYPRCAAIHALSSFLIYLKQHSFSSSCLKVIQLVEKLLTSPNQEMVIIIATLKLARVIDLYYNVDHTTTNTTIDSSIPSLQSLYGVIMILSYHSDDEIKYSALPLRTSLIGHVNPEKILTICSTLNENVLNPSLVDEEEKREAASYVLRFLVSFSELFIQGILSSNNSNTILKKFVKMIGHGLLLEVNRESPTIQANCLLFLRVLSEALVLCSQDNFLLENRIKNIFLLDQTSTRILQTLVQYLEYLLANNVKNFELEDEEGLFEENDDEEEEEDSEEEEEIEDSFKLPQKSSKFNAHRSKIIMDILASLLSLNILTKKKMTLVENRIKNIFTQFQSPQNDANLSFIIQSLPTSCSLKELLLKEIKHDSQPSNNPLLEELIIHQGSLFSEDVQLQELFTLKDRSELESDHPDTLYNVDHFNDYGFSLGEYRDGITSAFYSENLIIHALKNEKELNEKNLKTLISHLIESIEEDATECIEMYSFILYEYLCQTKYDHTSSMFSDLVENYLFDKVQDSEEQVLLAWYWRLLQVILMVTRNEKWSLQIQELFLSSVSGGVSGGDDLKSKLLKSGMSGVYVMACSCLLQSMIVTMNSSMTQSDENSSLLKQVVSDMITDEDIDEGKFMIQYMLHQVPFKLPLPTPKVDSVKANETFAPTQSK